MFAFKGNLTWRAKDWDLDPGYPERQTNTLSTDTRLLQGVTHHPGSKSAFPKRNPSFSTRTFWLCGNGTKHWASRCLVAQQLIMDTLCPCFSPPQKWLKLSVQTLAQRPEFLRVSHNTKQIPRVRRSSDSTRKMSRTF